MGGNGGNGQDILWPSGYFITEVVLSLNLGGLKHFPMLGFPTHSHGIQKGSRV